MDKKPIASVDVRGDTIVDVSDVIRWGDVVTINGEDTNIAELVEAGKRLDDVRYLKLAIQLERYLKSETGLLVTFPLFFLKNAVDAAERTFERYV